MLGNGSVLGRLSHPFARSSQQAYFSLNAEGRRTSIYHSARGAALLQCFSLPVRINL